MRSAPQTEPVRAGIYGAGAFGCFLATSLANSPALRVAAVASRRHTSAQRLAARLPGLQACQHYDSLLGRADIECIIVATPPADHAADAAKALEAGKHVLVEKPYAASESQALELAAKARRSALQSGVDFPMPYTAIVRSLVSLARSRACGRVQYVSVENVASCEGLDAGHWFWDREKSGGIFIEHGVHFFDWCGSLLERPQRVQAWTATQGSRENRVFAAVSYSGRQLASYYHAFVARPDTERTRVTVVFEEVDALVDGWMPCKLTFYGAGARQAAGFVRTQNGLALTASGPAAFCAGEKQTVYADAVRAVCADFAAAIRDPKHHRLVAQDRAVLSVRIADAARRAAATGAAVGLGGSAPAHAAGG
jgi:predicted dehydrogenase